MSKQNKKLFIMKIVVMVFIAANVTTYAAPTYTLSQTEIATLYQVTNGTLNYGPDAFGYWTATISDEGGGWGDLQIGRDATEEGPGSAFYSGSWADLSGYTDYALTITNTSPADWFMANIYLNTGYTDWGEPDNYYQNTWTWLAPCQSATLTLGLSGVTNLNHVSSIGFNIGTNVGDGEYYGDNLYGNVKPAQVYGDGDQCVIPAPGALLLGSIGVSVVGWLRRRRTL